MAELKQEWINTAIEALDKAYVPYSHFPVGACLVTESGKIYQGICCLMHLLKKIYNSCSFSQLTVEK